MIESKLKHNYTLAPLTTFKIGGKAEYLVEIKNREDLVEAIKWAEKNRKKYFILAGGSNVLVCDGLIEGLVMKMNNKEVNLKGERIECGSGVELPRLISLSLQNGLSGLEWGVGIPGSIGGAIRGNAGAYGSSICDSVETTEIFNIKRKKFINFSVKDLKFNYRHSIIKDNEHYLIWQVILKLSKGNPKNIKEKAENYLEKRIKSQPKLPSAGCIFKNLLFSELENENKLLARLAQESGIIKGGKVGAGWIIEQAGISGKRIGDAKISLEHSNFVVNTGNATADQVAMLISYIKQQVRTKLKICLKEEIQYFGF